MKYGLVDVDYQSVWSIQRPRLRHHFWHFIRSLKLYWTRINGWCAGWLIPDLFTCIGAWCNSLRWPVRAPIKRTLKCLRADIIDKASLIVVQQSGPVHIEHGRMIRLHNAHFFWFDGTGLYTTNSLKLFKFPISGALIALLFVYITGKLIQIETALSEYCIFLLNRLDGKFLC